MNLCSVGLSHGHSEPKSNPAVDFMSYFFHRSSSPHQPSTILQGLYLSSLENTSTRTQKYTLAAHIPPLSEEQPCQSVSPSLCNSEYRRKKKMLKVSERPFLLIQNENRMSLCLWMGPCGCFNPRVQCSLFSNFILN